MGAPAARRCPQDPMGAGGGRAGSHRGPRALRTTAHHRSGDISRDSNGAAGRQPVATTHRGTHRGWLAGCVAASATPVARLPLAPYLTGPVTLTESRRGAWEGGCGGAMRSVAAVHHRAGDGALLSLACPLTRAWTAAQQRAAAAAVRVVGTLPTRGRRPRPPAASPAASPRDAEENRGDAAGVVATVGGRGDCRLGSPTHTRPHTRKPRRPAPAVAR
jgi:hypothetical protein